jgi:hypothetical protein|tara:strand:- start:3845 stop:4090 length:246 start_codon:yes stop_codon:yes gene_type:complete
MTYKEIIRKMMLRGMLCPTVEDGRGLFWVSFNELELLEKEFDLKYLEETEEPKEQKEFFIDRQGRKQPVLSNPLKYTKKEN